MHSWTFRALILAVLSAVALIGAGVGMPAGATTVRLRPHDGFAGPLEAHAVVRPLARDLTKGSGGTLRQVPCAVGRAVHACFAAD